MLFYGDCGLSNILYKERTLCDWVSICDEPNWFRLHCMITNISFSLFHSNFLIMYHILFVLDCLESNVTFFGEKEIETYSNITKVQLICQEHKHHYWQQKKNTEKQVLLFLVERIWYFEQKAHIKTNVHSVLVRSQ